MLVARFYFCCNRDHCGAVLFTLPGKIAKSFMFPSFASFIQFINIPIKTVLLEPTILNQKSSMFAFREDR